MRKSFSLYLTIGLIIIGTSQAAAQDYKNAIGGRFGVANGVTFKTFLTGNKALDFILNFQSNRNISVFRLTGLYEIHTQIANAPGLKWYYGIGGSIGSLRDKDTDEEDLAVSLDGVLGLDYKFNGAPINLSLDWKPAIDIAPNTGFDAEGLGLSARFTF